jgi:integrase/recombinase XerD
MVAADVPDRGRLFYLVDDALEFVPEVQEFLDWKAATQRAPATLKGYCYRLSWYYRFLDQQGLGVRDVAPADVTEFVLWLCNPPRSAGTAASVYQPRPLGAKSVNLILQTVAALYRFLVRRGALAESPVRFVDVPRGRWLTERDLLAHTWTGGRARSVQRMELKLKEPKRLPQTVSARDFGVFVDRVHVARRPEDDPAGFRDRLICLVLKESGLRSGELLGLHVGDLDFGRGGLHVRFRPANENGARAKAGYGRDRFVHLTPDVLGLLDVYLSEVWVRVPPRTAHLWVVMRKDARTRDGVATVGTALTPAAVGKMFQYYSRMSGVTIHPHMLRHTHATDLVRSYLQAGQTVDWKYIQERLGHASVVTTMEIYTHLGDDDRKEAYDAYLRRRDAARTRRRGQPSRPDADEA